MTTEEQTGVATHERVTQQHSSAILLARILVLLLAAASIAWFCFSAKLLLLKYPPVWPDEACFASPAINLLQHHEMSTQVLTGALPGIEKHTYWMPPLYFLYVALVFLLTGPSLVALRLASFAPAVGVLLLTYLLARRVGLGRWLVFFQSPY